MRWAVGLITAATLAVVASAQPPADVDFRRDVQPIFREHCYGCHGPELRMNGFRLDRRTDAMRGGQQTNIGPGNADGSRLYQRLIGTKLGSQMPPAGTLSPQQIAAVKRWIDAGAVWPDDASGEPPMPPVDPDAARIVDAIRAGDTDVVGGLVAAHPGAINGYGARGFTPLLAASAYGDVALVKRLLAAGANPNQRSAGGLTPLMLAIPSFDMIRALLDAGADANARSDERRTALLVASGTPGGVPGLRLLLEYGADPFPWEPSEISPLREAARADDGEMFGLLMEYGLTLRGVGAPTATFVRVNCARCAEVAGAGPPIQRQPPNSSAGATSPPFDPNAARTPQIGTIQATPAAIRAAVERSLPLLQQIDVNFVQRTGCVSCHHNSLVAAAVAKARSRGFAVDDHVTTNQNRAIGAYLESWRERALQNIPIAGQQDTMSYLLLGLAAAGYAPDAATDAQAIWLKRRQAPDGRWPLNTMRPPIESNDIEVTATTMRALQLFAPPSQESEYQASVDRARAWLLRARAETTEERAFRLLGLAWANASADAIADAVRQLVAIQRPDGGWAQESKLSSDAYATGEALAALGEVRALDVTDPVVRKGIEFLLRTQHHDGTWFVESRSVPIQAYFESGFPYGVHQWISAAGTAWATTALAVAK